MNMVQAFNSLADTWTWQVGNAAWQAALVGCILILFVRWAERISARIRYAILLVALAKFAFPPLYSLPTGVFGWIEISRAEISANVQAGGTKEIIGSQSTIATVTQLSEVQGQSASRRSESQSEATVPIEPSRHSESITASSARDLLAGVIQSPINESSSASIHLRQSIVGSGNVSQTEAWLKAAMIPIAAVSGLGWLVLAHAFGMLVCIAMLSVRLLRLHRLRRSMMSPDRRLEATYRETAKVLQVRRLPELLVSSERTGPYSFGVLRPTIVVPSICAGHLSDEELRVALAHELVHHRRGDLVINAIQIVIAIVWWFHPIAWVLNKSIRRVREDCCDDALLESRVAGPSEYCQTLLNVANLCGCHRPRSGFAVSMSTDRIPLADRFRRIMDQRISRGSRFAWISGLGVLLVAMAVLPGLSQTSTNEGVAFKADANLSGASTPDSDEQARTPWPATTEFH